MTLSDLLLKSLERMPDFKDSTGKPAHKEVDGFDWSPADWMTALAGEVGETANILKKIRRGDTSLFEARKELAKELADIQCYLVLLANRCGIDLEVATILKFNEVSKRIGSDVRL